MRHQQASGQKLAGIVAWSADSEEFGAWYDIHDNNVAGTCLNCHPNGSGFLMNLCEGNQCHTQLCVCSRLEFILCSCQAG